MLIMYIYSIYMKNFISIPGGHVLEKLTKLTHLTTPCSEVPVEPILPDEGTFHTLI